MTLIMDDIGYLSLSKAAAKLDVAESELIDLASIGRITLSVIIPDDSSLWLMSVRKNISSMKYKTDINLGKHHLYPKKILGPVLINLSKDDCLRFESGALRQGLFESVYIVDQMAHCVDSSFNYLELVETDKKSFDKFPSEGEIERVYNQDYLDSCKRGFMALKDPLNQYVRRFLLFNSTFDVPPMGTSLADIKALNITENDLVIGANDFKKLQEERNCNSTLSFEQSAQMNAIIQENNERLKGELGEWCSNPLHYLIYVSFKVNQDYLEQNDNMYFLDKASSKIKYAPELINDVTTFIKSIQSKKDIGERLVEYFLKLAAPSEMLFKKKDYEGIKARLQDKDNNVDLPIQLLVMISIAKEIYLNKEKKSTTDGRFKELGFSKNLCENASTIIRRF